MLHPTLDEQSSINVIANGLPASPGAASGKVVFTSEEAERLTGMMQDTILVRVETSPEDIQGMHAAKGILTADLDVLLPERVCRIQSFLFSTVNSTSCMSR